MKIFFFLLLFPNYIFCQEKNPVVEIQRLENVSSTRAIELIKKGHREFSSNENIVKNNQELSIEEKVKRVPIAVIFSCSERASNFNKIFNQEEGKLFFLSTIGQINDNAVVASLEYATFNKGVNLLVMMTHRNCSIPKQSQSAIESSSNLLKKVKARLEKNSNHIKTENIQLLNLKSAALELQEKSSLIKNLISESKLKIIYGQIDDKTNEISWLEE